LEKRFPDSIRRNYLNVMIEIGRSI